MPVVGRRRDDHLADRRRVVEDVAEVGAQHGRVERLGAGQRVLLLDREQQLDADRRRPRRSRAARPRGTRRRRPCCRRRGSCRARSPSRRRRRTGSISPSTSTVSRCAHSSIVRSERPRMRGEQVAARVGLDARAPMPSSSRVTCAAISASWPNGLGIRHSAANVSFSRAFSASLAGRTSALLEAARGLVQRRRARGRSRPRAGRRGSARRSRAARAAGAARA